MKLLRKVLIAAALMCSAMLFVACGGGEKEKEYKVTVTDELGNLYDGAVVRFLQDGNQVALQVCDANGVASKTLPTGEYVVEIRFTDSDMVFYYDQSVAKLTAETTEITVKVSRAHEKASNNQELIVQENAYTAYEVVVGSTYVELEADERTYFVFVPTEAGVYEFGVIDDVANVGYYGAPHYVQENSALEVVDNKVQITVQKSMIGTSGTGTTVLVIGLDSVNGAENAILTVQRVSDAPISETEAEWIVYQPTTPPSPYVVEEGTELKNFDITQGGYNLVYNEADGFYHLDSVDGPLVYMYLTVNSPYLDALSLVSEKSSVSKYFYDEDGNFIKRESYNECLNKYIECADEKLGVYPLTKDLEYIIKMRGDHYGWYDIENEAGYLFKDMNGNFLTDINEEISWLFPCCYEVK